MNNGHTTPPTDLPEFSNPDNFESDGNLDLTNPETGWGQPVSIEHDKKSLGSEALNSLEASTPASEQSDAPKLGEITPYLPPGVDPKLYDEPTSVASDADIVKESLAPNLDAIKTTDRLSEESVKIIDSSINEFNQDSISPASFYEQVRNAMETNIENSYNRKLGER